MKKQVLKGYIKPNAHYTAELNILRDIINTAEL